MSNDIFPNKGQNWNKCVEKSSKHIASLLKNIGKDTTIGISRNELMRGGCVRGVWFRRVPKIQEGRKWRRRNEDDISGVSRWRQEPASALRFVRTWDTLSSQDRYILREQPCQDFAMISGWLCAPRIRTPRFISPLAQRTAVPLGVHERELMEPLKVPGGAAVDRPLHWA